MFNNCWFVLQCTTCTQYQCQIRMTSKIERLQFQVILIKGGALLLLSSGFEHTSKLIAEDFHQAEKLFH